MRAEKLGGARVELPQWLARIALVARATHFAHLDAALCSDPLHRFDEVEAELLLDEGEDVARLVAHEAVVAARRHGEVRPLSVVKRARAAEAVSHALELHILTDDGHDVGFLPNAV